MSNLIINWRFGAWHFQVIRLSDWRHSAPISISRNELHAPGGWLRARKGWRWAEFYEGGPLLAGTILALGMIAGIIWGWNA